MNYSPKTTKEQKLTPNSLLVAVRVRPLTEAEQLKGVDKSLHVLDKNVLVLYDREVPRINSEWTKQRGTDKHYEFDIILNENSTQSEVFESTCPTIITGVIQGYNSSIFAYGPTGSGKSYTMLGTDSEPGLVYRASSIIYQEIDHFSSTQDFKVSIGFLEIYNENIKDLLNSQKIGLDIREDPQKGVYVAGLRENIVTNVEEVEKLVRVGVNRRITESTMANVVSSRSHAIIQITVESREKVLADSYEISVGKLNLIDLAGSERASKTRNKGARLLEGANINRSLLSLGNCINALSEVHMRGRRVFVPYRDSKLTRLLKDSLGGNCRTVMITCLSPAFYNYEDTFNTLVYATRAKNIKTKIHKNKINVQEHISKYTGIISNLKKEIKSLRAQLGASVNSPKLDNFLIVISEHFEKEAGIRKNIYVTQQKIANIGFTLFNLQTQLNSSLEGRPESTNTKSIKSEIAKQKKMVEELQDYENQCRKKLESLHTKQEEMNENWTTSGIDPGSLSQLRLELKRHLILMNSLDFQGIETSNKLMIEQKDMYIRFLEDQLKLRDFILAKESPKLDTSAMKSYKSYEEISTYFVPGNSNHSPRKEQSVGRLPSIKKTRIPRIETSPYVARTGDREGYSKKYANKNRGYSFESLGSAASTNLTLPEKKLKKPTISDKYSNGKYVRNWKRNHTPNSNVN